MSTETKPAEWVVTASDEIESALHLPREWGGSNATIAAIIAKHAPAQTESEAIGALQVLANIADAYDANELDDEARKFWGANDEHQNCHAPSSIELYSGRGGKRLLTLEDCMKARAILARHDKK